MYVLHGVSCQNRYKKTMPFCKKNSEKRFKEHLSSDFLCKNFIGLGQISWPQHQFEVQWAFKGEAFFTWFWF